ncbi:MAG: LptF/LptG family permease [Fimbriimonadaceae bacterium]|nr:LptF/LptG family permease [Alphaproteobacteria bacterium]
MSDVTKSTLIILTGIEAIFLSDLIISHILPHVLAHQAGVTDLFLLTVLAVPEGLYIALPLALLIAVYLVILRRKEEQEFTIVAGMGYSARMLVAVGLFLGLSSAAISLGLSGYLEPHARYQMTTAFSSISHRALQDGEMSSGKFYEMGDVTIFASRGRLSKMASEVFIHQRLTGDQNRIVIANQTVNLSMTEGAKIGLILDDVAIYEFALHRPTPFSSQNSGAKTQACTGCKEEVTISPIKQQFFNKFFAELPTVEFPELRARGAIVEEMTIPELFLQNTAQKDVARMLGERLMRAVLCVLAPFLALLSVALTTNRTLLFSLPAATSLVLAASFFGSHIIKFLAPLGFVITAGITIVVAAITALIVIFLIYRFETNYTRSVGVNV